YFMAKKYRFPRRMRRSSLSEILRATYETIPCLVLPVIILGGIASGVFTATESGAIATLYALFISCFVMRTISLRDVLMCCRRAAKTTANVLFIIAVASAMGWAITTMRIPQQVTEFCLQNIGSRWVFLLFINVLLLIIGMIVDQSPALLIMVPILLPISLNFGIHPLHFGIIVCLNLTIGLITPPVGMTLFVTANVGKIKLTRLYRSIIPFVCICMAVLALVSCFESFTTWLPGVIL
ncbi:MAG: TRAP transporter large permease, partial [Planctomycetes bacterium]|nr:TRAP transporter large permease [Planctomycetota bacterium]